ncbi:opioid growth factor receptor-like protein [Rhizoctonia solani 123E]|uniref:Opioid growth factor receptor-like protein n=1 Tax=Rhizoctonia solani 123E TaxID=1423351 RepID=A0A074SAL8_9AGAM|nr:opioid growth factor receptor-like protein [Rhizoctonia solani 123E]
MQARYLSSRFFLQPKAKAFRLPQMSRFSSMHPDVKEFLDGYPNIDHTGPPNPDHINLKFYSNELKCLPDKLLIEELLDKWQGNYDDLEWSHGFIQWLFPIPEQGKHRVNSKARPLTRYEMEQINSSPALLIRLRRAYELMLDFYGMKLLDAESGLVGRKDDGWKERYENLVSAAHNNSRITRILKCLSILSYPHYAAPFVLHVLNEQSEHGQLDTFVLQKSLDGWWANCNRNDQEREAIREIITRIRDKTNNWTFTRAAYEQMIHARATQNTLTLPN